MKVKVCGMNDVAQIKQLATMQVDFAGFIFYPPSPRYISKNVKDFLANNDLSIPKVGVFVNEKKELVKELAAIYHLDYVQLHGDEDADYCHSCTSFVKVIKAIRIAENTDIKKQIALFQNNIDLFLFDTDTKAYGGSGRKFDWQILHKTNINKPYLLSGGISADDTEAIKNFALKANKHFLGVDVNSKFEISAGVKDLNSITNFIRELNGD